MSASLGWQRYCDRADGHVDVGGLLPYSHRFVRAAAPAHLWCIFYGDLTFSSGVAIYVIAGGMRATLLCD